MSPFDVSPVSGMNYMDTVSNGSARQFSSRMSNNNNTVGGPSATINMNWLIYTYYSRQDFATCAAIVDKQLCNHVDKAYAYHVKGLIARQQGELVESLQCLQQAINLEPTSANNYKEIGRTLLALGRIRHALDAFRRAEALSTRPDAEIYYHIGELLMRKSEQNTTDPPTISKQQGTSIAKEAVVGPSLPALNAYAVEAKQYFMQSIQHDNRQVQSFRKLSTIFVRESDYPRAIEMLESVAQILPDNVEILSEVGCLYLHVNDTKNAFDRLLLAMKLNERYTKALLALGAIYQSKNDVDGALNKYKLINVSTEDSCELWSNIGLCFLKKRKFVAAIACLKKSVWMSPLNFNCVFNLAMALLTAQQYASAYYAFSVAANIRPNHAETLMFIGICLRNLRDVGNAAVAFERATLLPEALINPLIYLNFAVFCYEIGQPKAAHEAIANVTQMIEQVPMRKEYMKVLLTMQQRLESEFAKAVTSDTDISDETPTTTVDDRNRPDDDKQDGDLV